MFEILTDQTILRQKSEPIKPDEIKEVLKELYDNIPRDALGLAAPQLGLFKRVFFAKLPEGYFAFINPKIIWSSQDHVPSVEACLSIPDTVRCVQRHSQVTVKIDTLIKIPSLTVYVPFEYRSDSEPIRMKDGDAFVIQHELDHLDGILFIDRPKAQTTEQKIYQRDMNRKKRIKTRRRKQIIIPTPPPKINAKKAAKLKKIAQKKKRAARTMKRRQGFRVKIEERHRAEKEELLSNEQTDPKEPSEAQE